MIAESMDKLITLREPTSSDDDHGQKTESFSDWDDVFANVTQQGSREVFRSGKVSEVNAVFKIRYLSEIDETWQIVWDGVTYKIIGRPKELGRQDGLEIMGKAQI